MWARFSADPLGILIFSGRLCCNSDGSSGETGQLDQIAKMSLLLVPVRQEIHFGAVEPLHTRAIPPGVVLRQYIKAIICDYAEVTHRRALRRGVKERSVVLTVYSSFVTFTSSSCIWIPISLL